jgi:hypothetical protein
MPRTYGSSHAHTHMSQHMSQHVSQCQHTSSRVPVYRGRRSSIVNKFIARRARNAHRTHNARPVTAADLLQMRDAILAERVRAWVNDIRMPMHDAEHMKVRMRSAFAENSHLLVSGEYADGELTEHATTRAIYARRFDDGSTTQIAACVVDGQWLVCRPSTRGRHFTLAFAPRFISPFEQLPRFVHLTPVSDIDSVHAPTTLDPSIGLYRCGEITLVNLHFICGRENISTGCTGTIHSIVHDVLVDGMWA